MNLIHKFKLNYLLITHTNTICFHAMRPSKYVNNVATTYKWREECSEEETGRERRGREKEKWEEMKEGVERAEARGGEERERRDETREGEGEEWIK